MLDFYIIINSYEREETLLSLLEDIVFNSEVERIKVKSYIDGSQYETIDGSFKYMNVYYDQQTVEHHGKQNYHKLIKRGWNEAEPAKYYMNLPDDIRLTENFFERAIECFESQDIFCLDLMKDNRDKGIIKKYELTSRCKTQDLCIMYKKEFLDLFKYYEFEPPKDLKGSSGVSKQINRKLRDKELHIVNETLVHHGDHESKMNPGKKKIIS